MRSSYKIGRFWKDLGRTKQFDHLPKCNGWRSGRHIFVLVGSNPTVVIIPMFLSSVSGGLAAKLATIEADFASSSPPRVRGDFFIVKRHSQKGPGVCMKNSTRASRRGKKCRIILGITMEARIVLGSGGGCLQCNQVCELRKGTELEKSAKIIDGIDTNTIHKVYRVQCNIINKG